MIRASIIISVLVFAVLIFAWNMTQRNYNLIREEIKSATEGSQCGRGE